MFYIIETRYQLTLKIKSEATKLLQNSFTLKHPLFHVFFCFRSSFHIVFVFLHVLFNNKKLLMFKIQTVHHYWCCQQIQYFHFMTQFICSLDKCTFRKHVLGTTVKPGYNDHGYNKFTFITNQILLNFWSQMITLQNKPSRL